MLALRRRQADHLNPRMAKSALGHGQTTVDRKQVASDIVVFRQESDRPGNILRFAKSLKGDPLP